MEDKEYDELLQKATTCKEYDKLLQEATTWNCDFLYDVAEQNTDGGVQNTIVNLSADYFATGKTYMFPDHICGKSKQKELVVSLKRAGVKCGFNLVTVPFEFHTVTPHQSDANCLNLKQHN